MFSLQIMQRVSTDFIPHYAVFLLNIAVAKKVIAQCKTSTMTRLYSPWWGGTI